MKSIKQVAVAVGMALALVATPAAAATTPDDSRTLKLPPGNYEVGVPEAQWTVHNWVLTKSYYKGGFTKKELWNANGLYFQNDGNLVHYDKYGRATWASGTADRGDWLVLQSDGNVVIYDGNRAIWASHTIPPGIPVTKLIVTYATCWQAIATSGVWNDPVIVTFSTCGK